MKLLIFIVHEKFIMCGGPTERRESVGDAEKNKEK